MTLTGALAVSGTGAFTLGDAPFSTGSLSQTNGTFTGNATGSIGTSGNVAITGGTHTHGGYTLTMSGAPASINANRASACSR